MRPALTALAVLVALGSSAVLAQTFEGLDLGTPAKKQKRKKKPSEARPPAPAPTPAPTPEPEARPAPTPAPLKPAEKEKEKEKPPEKPATLSFDAVNVGGKTGERQRLNAAIQQFKSGEYELAALAFGELSLDPALEAFVVESDYWLGKSLYKLGMYHSALSVFSRVLARGPDTRFFKTSLEWLFFIGRKTVNETVVLDELARYANYEFPDRFKSEFRYLLARYNLVRGKALDEAELKGEADVSYEEVRRLVQQIPTGDPFFARGKYLEGLAAFRDDKLEAAVAAMQEVVRVTRTEEGQKLDRNTQALRELAFMQLARTHFGAKQNRKALFYYGKIERGGPQWLEALFEASWANYRIGQSEQALGNLITLSSPFFRDEYFPEALILKAVIYFENCRYREALSIVEDFERIYGPVQEELERLVKQDLQAREYFEVLDQVQRKNKAGQALTGTDLLLERILNLALTEKDLKKTSDSIGELEEELDSFARRGDAFKFSALAQKLQEALKAQRVELVKKAGGLAKGKLSFELGQLKTYRANGLRIRFETTTREKEFLEAQLRAGGPTSLVKSYSYSVAVDDDSLYWPYVGEYWRDELGTYQYTLTKGCIEKQASGRSE